MSSPGTLEKLTNLRVLVIQKMGHIGGAEKNLERWINHFIEKYQFKVSICGPGDGVFFQRMDEKGIPCFKSALPDWRKGKNLIARYLAQMRITKILGEEKFDLIFVNDFFYAPYGVYLSRQRKIPIIVHIQSDCTPDRIKQYHMENLNALIVTTKSTFNKIKYSVSREGALRLIQYGVDDKCVSTRKIPSSNKGNFVFGIAANILPHKGIDFFLKLVQELKEQDGWEIHWVGGDPQNRLKDLREKIQTMGLHERVFLHGFLEDMESFYSSIDCLIHPAEFEPFGLVLIEAMSYGLPVISTRTAGGVEILGNFDEGRWLVPLDGYKEMSKLMIKLIEKPELVSTASQLFFEKYTNNYRHSIAMEKMEECFTLAISSSDSERVS
ncbi:MAG: glycosyltransferase family 4 protein [Leptospirillum sp.]